MRKKTKWPACWGRGDFATSRDLRAEGGYFGRRRGAVQQELLPVPSNFEKGAQRDARFEGAGRDCIRAKRAEQGQQVQVRFEARPTPKSRHKDTHQDGTSKEAQDHAAQRVIGYHPPGVGAEQDKQRVKNAYGRVRRLDDAGDTAGRGRRALDREVKTPGEEADARSRGKTRDP